MKVYDPEIWGPTAWRCLHTLATVATPSQMGRLLWAFTETIPCTSCAEHLIKHLKERDPVTVPARYFVFALHNEASFWLKKPLRDIEILDRYTTPRHSNHYKKDLEALARVMTQMHGERAVSKFLKIASEIESMEFRN